MKKIKKLLSVILVATMVFTTFSIGITASAESATAEIGTTADSPLEVVVTTNESDYGKFDVAEITVTVTNISDETVENVSAEAVFSDLAPVDSLYSETSKKAETLKPGENFSFSYKATLSLDNSDVGFFSKIILWFVRLFNDGYTVTSGDSEADIENVTEIKFGKVSADNKIKVWYKGEISDTDFNTFQSIRKSIENVSEKEKVIDILNNEINNGNVIDYHVFENYVTFETVFGINGIWEDETFFDSENKSVSLSGKTNKVKKTPSGNSYKDIINQVTSSSVVSSIGDIAVIRPYRSTDFKYDDFLTTGEIIADAIGSEIDVYDNSNATLSVLKSLDNYGIILFDSHGTLISNETYICLTQTYNNQEVHSSDLDSIFVNQSNQIYINSNFFEENYINNAFDECLVFLGTCYSMYDNSFSDTLISKGVDCVYGYTNPVSVTYCNDTLVESMLENILLAQNTSREAYNETISICGQTDPHNANTDFVMQQSGDFCLSKTGYTVGTVKDSVNDKVISGVTVTASNEFYTTTGQTDSNGVFRIKLPVGTYKLTLSYNGYTYKQERTIIVQENVTKTEGVLYLYNGIINGYVKDETTGNTISGVRVEFIDNSSDGFDPVATATTDTNGLFSVKLPYGSYSLSFNHDNYEYYGTTVNVDTENVVLTNPVLLSPKNSSGGGSEDDRTIIDSGSCGADGDNVKWTLYDNGELVISGNGAMADYYYDSTSSNLENSKLPPWFNYQILIKEITIKNNVSSIGNYSFFPCFYVTNINMPNCITRIGDFAFAYCSITTITIPESVSDIGESPFYACESLTNIMVSEENQFFTNDEYGVLYNKDKTRLIQYPIGNDKTSYTVPNGVSKIANGAFISCEYLTEILISDTVNSIGVNVFALCDNLSKVTIGKGVTNIEMGAFIGCYELTEIIIPENVKVIGDYAFYYTGITYLNIPDSTTTIGEYAFTNCELETVTLGKGVTDIGENAFAGNPISKISVDSNNKYFLADEYGALYNKDKTILIQYPCRSTYTEYTIPDSVITIESNAFRVSKNLTEITLGNNLRTIENSCFESCENLNRLVVPDSVETIGDMAFADCGITDLVIGNSVRVIGTGAFSWCDFTNLVLPESVEIIQDEAFAYNSYLVNIVIPKSVTYIGKDAFYGCNDLTSITVDENNQNYSSDDGGVLFNKEKTILIKYPKARSSTSYIIPNSVTAVADKAFYSCNNLTNIIIPDSITTIGAYAFCLCENLVEITVPNNLTNIGESVFAYCNNLKSITIPKSVTAIASQAFHGCEALTDVYYKGTSTSWNAITIEDFNNDYLKNATIHYNS